MKHLVRGTLLSLLCVGLASCTANESEPSEETDVTGARSAIEWTVRVAQGVTDLNKLRPSALLGLYVSEYLLHSSLFRSALAGIEAQMELILNEDEEEEEAFALLAELGSMLQIDIVDMLNRSADRPVTFDEYVVELKDVARRSEGRLEALEQELETINDERRDRRKEASDIQHDLNTALRGEDYSTASDLQRRIIDAEAELARVESQEDEQRSIINLYENLLDIAEERLTAMQSNREALLAGVTVTEVPGIDDLGLIEQGRRSRRGSGNGSIFDPGIGEWGS